MRLLLGLWLASSLFLPALSAQPDRETIDSFEKVWQTVQSRYWQPTHLDRLANGQSWRQLHDTYRAKVERAADNSEARRLMSEMLGLLGQSHFAIISGQLEDDLAPSSFGDGTAGIEPVLVGSAVLVMRVEPQSGAAQALVKPGWEILRIGETDVRALAQRLLEKDPSVKQRNLLLRWGVLGRLSGPSGTTVRVEFINGAGQKVIKQVPLKDPPGTRVRFGFMPPTPLTFRVARPRPDIQYVRFNIFLDPPGLMGKFEDAVKTCTGGKNCQGFIIDLRGNPGGLAILASGMAGFFIDQPDTKLGTLYQREVTLKLVVNPRVDTFSGPLAILVDGASVSTSEIMAGGLQDLKRARIFGSRTAGAALPSNVERLPNGDLFQYAVANYISEGGQTLEGRGVIPDQEVGVSRAALLAGQDPVLEAAINWIRAQPRP
jgi:carboxyl-terminal processing protease